MAKRQLELFFVLLAMCTPTYEELIQVDTINIICPNDQVVFVCNTNNEFLDWDIRIPLGYRFQTSFNRFGSQINVSQSQTLGSTLLEVRVVFKNSTTIRSELTLNETHGINGSIIICNEDTLPLHIMDIGKEVLPDMLILTPLNADNFLISWSIKQSLKIVDYFNITILLHPVLNSTKIITNEPSTVFKFKNDSNYDIILSTTFCRGESFDQKFKAGTCPMIIGSQVIYILWPSGNKSALINNDENRILKHCDWNGNWLTDRPLYYSSSSEKTEGNNITTPSPIVSVSIRQEDSTCNEVTIRLVAISSCSSMFLTLISVSITCLVLQKCFSKSSKQKKSSVTIPIPKPAESLVYEEVQEVYALNKFQITTNNAYGNTNEL